MTGHDIARQRLAGLGLASATSADAAAVVGRLAAVQAQDYAGAKWALGLRTAGATDATVERALATGAILRTHLLRPTWHFVLPADIRWLLALTAPQVNAAMAYNFRRLELDDAVVSRSNAALAQALRGDRQLTRAELVPVLAQAGIATNDLRFTHLIMRAELDGVLCSGPRRGKQFTYALLEERVPPTRPLAHDEALAELTRRYFTSRGPATVKDYRWWSGLSTADARAGLDSVRQELEREVVEDAEYWFAARQATTREDGPAACLLPNYDEYVVGYADRSAVFDAQFRPALGPRDSVLFNNIVVAEGRVIGTWKRAIKRDAVAVTISPFTSLEPATARAVAAATARYGAFLGLPVAEA